MDNIEVGMRVLYVSQNAGSAWADRFGKSAIVLNTYEVGDLQMATIRFDDELMDRCAYLKSLVRLPEPPVTAAEEALNEILSTHANDNHRPKAFYIAARYFENKV